jgi:PAS domain-containing protein
MNKFQDIDFRAILNKMDQIIYISDPKSYEILYVNKKTEDLFEGLLLGKNFIKYCKI